MSVRQKWSETDVGAKVSEELRMARADCDAIGDALAIVSDDLPPDASALIVMDARKSLVHLRSYIEQLLRYAELKVGH
jgi:hypothetical protein